METNRQRIEQFKSEVEDMDVRPPEDSSERLWLLGGVVLPIVGLLVILGGWWGASGTAYTSEQIPYLLSGGVFGVGLIVIGAALFVRYSMTRYLRYWIVRVIYEQRSQTDRQIEALREIAAALSGDGRSAQKTDA